MNATQKSVRLSVVPSAQPRFGQWLRKRRMEANITLPQFASACTAYAEYIDDIERGRIKWIEPWSREHMISVLDRLIAAKQN